MCLPVSFWLATTCRAAVPEWLNLSVQIQMSHLFVFVLRELFLAGHPTGGTQSGGPFICLRCDLFQPPAVICFVARLCGCKVENSHSCSNAWLQGSPFCRPPQYIQRVYRWDWYIRIWGFEWRTQNLMHICTLKAFLTTNVESSQPPAAHGVSLSRTEIKQHMNKHQL